MKITIRKKYRRANGHGSIQHINKWWYVRAPFDLSTSRRESLGRFKKKSDAEKCLTNYLLFNKAKIKSSSLLAVFLNDWIRKLKNKLKESTIDSYKSQIKNNVIPYIGNIALCSLKGKDIDNMTSSLLERGLTSNSVNAAIRILKTALNYAVRNDLIYKNPIKKAMKIKPSPRKKIIPNYNQIELLVKRFMKEPVYKIPFLFCLCEGLRRGEALGVKWEDINLETRVISIRRQISIDEKRIVIRPLKTDKPERSFVLSEITLEELNKVLKSDRFGFIVKNEYRNPNRFYNKFVKIREELGLDGVCIHSLRHASASILLNNYVPIDIVSKRLGHSSIKITGDIYDHNIMNNQKQSADVMSGIMRNIMSK